MAWDKQTRRYENIMRPPAAYDNAAELLAEYHSMSAVELATLAGIHVGNARKHFALLAAQGRAERLDDGQWVLTAQQQQGAA
jgi:predicted ArsR family transcriptional regulator